jgi:hypothetical protein
MYFTKDFEETSKMLCLFAIKLLILKLPLSNLRKIDLFFEINFNMFSIFLKE